MPSWWTTFDPIFSTDKGAKRALKALEYVSKLLQIPPIATWKAFRRGIGVVVVAEWPYDELWVGGTCVVCGDTGPLHEHVHPERLAGDSEALAEAIEEGLRTLEEAPATQPER